MIDNASMFFYLEGEAKKIIDKQGEAKLLKSTIEFYKTVKKIEKAFANYDEYPGNIVRIQIVIDEHKVVGTFDYKIK